MRNYLKNLAIAHEGDYRKIEKAIQNREVVKEYACASPYVCIGDDAYPKVLYELEKPPFVLFYSGDLSLLKRPCMSIVGSREPSQYAYEQTQQLVDKLKRNYVIVSGLAKGIDALSHRSALDFSTIAVLGCGIDVIYPQCNASLFKVMRKNQLILSEYPPGVKPRRYFFPFRNRIIAALSPTLYVMSATKRSGTMTTVNEALSLNRHVICLPHPITLATGEGCNQLIKEGADILTSLHDL